MPLGINNNLAAFHLANTLSGHYRQLGASTQKLATGLRINSAADDASSLAIRELMRSDIASFQQGVRNANDAINMIQVADGALSIIDEKLIRMKELAEQAATGTYDSTQRMIIDSEFQAMGSEIDRIANATDFNGRKLLDGSLDGEHSGKKLDSTGRMKIHFGTQNDSAEDYYYVNIKRSDTAGLGLRKRLFLNDANVPWLNDPNMVVDLENRTLALNIAAPGLLAGENTYKVGTIPGIDYYPLPIGLENVVIKSDATKNFAHKPHVNLFTRDGRQITGIKPVITSTRDVENYWNTNDPQPQEFVINKLIQANLLNADATYKNDLTPTGGLVINAGDTVNVGGMTVQMVTARTNVHGEEIITIDKISSSLVFLIGGHENGYCNAYSLQIEARIGDNVLDDITSWGPMIDITTQANAQTALESLDRAMISKDSIRADLGAMQNRLENTVANINIQAENLQASESRISDVDVSKEMTSFVRKQILAQSAIAMLSQAYATPQMALKLIG